MKTDVEWAFRARREGVMVDVDVYNKRTCNWNEPIHEWDKIILNGYLFDYNKRKYGKSLVLVKRITKTQTIWRAE